MYEALKEDSRKGDFVKVSLMTNDMEKLDILIPGDEIKSLKKIDWKKYKHEIINKTAFVSLVNENKENFKYKHI